MASNAQVIYEKFTNGDPLTDRELSEGIKHFTKTEQLLTEAGPVFKLAASEARRVVNGLESFQFHRKIDKPSKKKSDDDFNTKYTYYQKWGKEHGITTSIWSVYDVPIGGLDVVAFENVSAVRYDGGWGTGGEIETNDWNLTWGDIWKLADKLIAASGDLHHIFIETVKINKSKVVNITTGS